MKGIAHIIGLTIVVTLTMALVIGWQIPTADSPMLPRRYVLFVVETTRKGVNLYDKAYYKPVPTLPCQFREVLYEWLAEMPEVWEGI